MGKNIVFFCNGTGNVKNYGPDTNVERLFARARHDKGEAPEQVTHYIDGVGIEFGDLVGKALGKGISQNIKDGYDFITRWYLPGDRIFLFGFSRGAYAVRSIGGMLGRIGIPSRKQDEDVDLRADHRIRGDLISRAYDIYKIQDHDKRKKTAEAFRAAHCYREHQEDAARAPYLIGVWDTVRSLGIPLGVKDFELALWPHRFHDHDLNPHVAHAYHAVSIDEERQQFLPTIWNEPTKAERLAAETGEPNRQRFEQVWFPGVHSDVGGGYADDRRALADVTLRWMIERAAAAGLLFTADHEDDPAGDLPRTAPQGQVNDSRDTPFKRFLYPRHPRQVVRGHQAPDSKTISPIGKGRLHRSAIDRIVHLNGTAASYRPDSLARHDDYLAALATLAAGKNIPPDPWPDEA